MTVSWLTSVRLVMLEGQFGLAGPFRWVTQSDLDQSIRKLGSNRS